MFFLGCSIYIYIYTCIVFTFVVTPCQNLPHQFNTSGNVITSQKSVFSNAIYIYIYVDAQLILNMYISFHSYIYIYIYIHTCRIHHMSSWLLRLTPPPFLALKHAFSSMGSLQDGSNVMKPLNIEMVKCDCTFANVEARWKLGEYMLFNVV